MSIFEKIIFISDYAEDTRKYESCIRVRDVLFDNIENLCDKDLKRRLDEVTLMSIDGTLEALERTGQPINSRMYLTKKSLLGNILQS